MAQIDRIAVGTLAAAAGVVTAGGATAATLSLLQSVAGAVRTERKIKLTEKQEDKLDAEEEKILADLERRLMARQMGLREFSDGNIVDAAVKTVRG